MSLIIICKCISKIYFLLIELQTSSSISIYYSFTEALAVECETYSYASTLCDFGVVKCHTLYQQHILQVYLQEAS